MFYILESVLNIGYLLLFSFVSCIAIELCLRLTSPEKNRQKTFWQSSVTISVTTFFSFCVAFLLNKQFLILHHFTDQLPLLAFIIGICIPLAIGLVLGYCIAERSHAEISRKIYSLSIMVVNILTTFTLSLFLGCVLCFFLFLVASDIGGSHILRTTYGTFHYFNQHVRNLCINYTCAKDISEIKAFDPQRFNYLYLMTEIQYQTDGEHDYHFSVKFNPNTVMSSTENSDLLFYSEREARKQGLWR